MKRFVLLILTFSGFLSAGWHMYPHYPAYLKKRASMTKKFYLKANTSKKVVALTFDDGPNRHTPKIMSVLNKYKAPATFFLIGKNVKKGSYKLYRNPLFSTGMHSLTHKNFDKMKADQIREDFTKTIAVFKKNNLDYRFFRTPYGVVNKEVVDNLSKNRLQGVLWSNDTFDWDKKRRSYQAVLDYLSSGDIILMHDHATKPAELEALIRGIQAKGYNIVSLEDLMKYKSEYL